ncbi:MAG: hypothetical protein ACQESP_00145 [Candidatus Muiribacteriota bacterium]
MRHCNECGNEMQEFFEWKFEYGLKKKQIVKCENCGEKITMGLVEL